MKAIISETDGEWFVYYKGARYELDRVHDGHYDATDDITLLAHYAEECLADHGRQADEFEVIL